MITAHMIRRESGQYDCEVIQRLKLERQGIDSISNLDECVGLLDLSIAWNQITRIIGLDSLVNLQRLDLSHNQITRIDNLSSLSSLDFLDLRANMIASVDDVNELSSLSCLRSLFFRGSDGEDANPACMHPAYATIVMNALPELTLLDGGHLALVDATASLERRLADIRPSEQALTTPPSEPWLSAAELAEADSDPIFEDAGVSVGASDAVRPYKAVHESLARAAELLTEDSVLLLRKAQTAILKAAREIPAATAADV